MPTMRRISILQSNYIPWKGYFDIIASVDEFILYDEVQFTKNDWRNRNRVKTPAGPKWLTIPVGTNLNRRICEVALPRGDWRIKHWKTLECNYRRAPYFEEVAALCRPLYESEHHSMLSEFNRAFIEAVCEYLGIETRISSSLAYPGQSGRNERLIDLCTQAGASDYVSGPSAKAYLDESAFRSCGIAVHWFEYSGYPSYGQLWGDFMHEVSILDLLFNCGPDSPRFMKFRAP